MNCSNCKGKYVKRHGTIQMKDGIVGNYSVDNVQYYTCNNCGDTIFSMDTLKIIEKVRDEIENRLIKEHPLDDFIPASEAAAILEISRQALHKHKRIRRGFIFKTKIAGIDLYLKKSVLMFKETGDGRFPLQLTKRQEIKEEKVQVSREVFLIRPEESFEERYFWGLKMKKKKLYKESTAIEADEEYFDSFPENESILERASF